MAPVRIASKLPLPAGLPALALSPAPASAGRDGREPRGKGPPWPCSFPTCEPLTCVCHPAGADKDHPDRAGGREAYFKGRITLRSPSDSNREDIPLAPPGDEGAGGEGMLMPGSRRRGPGGEGGGPEGELMGPMRPCAHRGPPWRCVRSEGQMPGRGNLVPRRGSRRESRAGIVLLPEQGGAVPKGVFRK